MTGEAENKGVIYEFGRFVLDPQERVLIENGKSIHLTDKVFDVLLLLIQHRGKLLTKDEMISAIWDDSFVEESNLARNVSRLRKILNTDGLEMIETIPRHGYRFLADVRETGGETNVLVHRNLRVRMTRTVDDEAAYPDEPDTAVTPLPLRAAAGSRFNIRWIAGAVVAVLLAAAGVSFYFIRTDHTQSGDLVNLTNNLAVDDVPSLSPDGTKIAFMSNRDGAGDIYVMDADGSNVVRLTRAPAIDASPVWTPDGTRIVFDTGRDGNREIYVMNADGSDQRRLTFNPSSDVGPVSFSPDGTQLAFARNKAETGAASFLYDVFVMKADGSGVRQLTTDPEFDAEPAWSPDGSRILFISARDGNFDLYAINPDGTGEVNLTRTPASREGSPKFTPDGSQFFCLGADEEVSNLNQIYLGNANDMSRRQITSFTDPVGRISFSPSTRKFVLTIMKDGNWDIFSMDAKNLLEKGPL